MKKLALAGAALVLAMSAGSASAANSLNAGTIGLNVDTYDSFVINGKYLVSKDLAVLGGFGIAIAGGDAKGTDTGFLIGVRKYLKTDDFAPFVGGRFTYLSTNDSTTTGLQFIGEVGAEYFLGKQFSLEGRVGFGYSSVETEVAPTITSKVTSIGTSTATISANFYF
jgi:hypothetical protein